MLDRIMNWALDLWLMRRAECLLFGHYYRDHNVCLFCEKPNPNWRAPDGGSDET